MPTRSPNTEVTKALGDHQVYDAVSKTNKALRDHPALGQINAGIIGLQAIRDLSGGLTALSTYSRSSFISGVLSNVHALQNQFTTKPTYLAYFSMQDTTRNPSLDEDLIDAITTEFNGRDATHPHIGLFQEALRETTLSRTRATVSQQSAHGTYRRMFHHVSSPAAVAHSPLLYVLPTA